MARTWFADAHKISAADDAEIEAWEAEWRKYDPWNYLRKYPSGIPLTASEKLLATAGIAAMAWAFVALVTWLHFR